MLTYKDNNQKTSHPKTNKKHASNDTMIQKFTKTEEYQIS